MSLPGLSLVGYMDEQDAMEYQRTQCVCNDPSDNALRTQWKEARARLGHPIARAGMPSILNISAKHNAHLDGVHNNPRYDETVGKMSFAFKQVEIATILAFQFHVHTQKELTPVAAARLAPTMEQLLQWCLPHSAEHMKAEVIAKGNEIRVTSSNINLALIKSQVGQTTAEQLTPITLEIGPRSNLMQVVHFQGRYYLKNGYHRAYQLGKLGVKYMPCLLLQGTSWEDVGALGPRVFPQALLESSNPPTCGHFLQDRAYAVTLATYRRVIRMVMTADLELVEE